MSGRQGLARVAIAAGIGFFSHAALAENSFSVGVEGFRDHYSEPDLRVDNHADYGSLTASYTFYEDDLFAGIDGRASYGSDDYKSPDGTSGNTPQYEFETRVVGGVRLPFIGDALSDGDNSLDRYYTGLGTRYFYDDGKGVVTNMGFYGYDRRILQFYVPIGATMPFTVGSWTLTPNLEYDQLLRGFVNSRLQNVAPIYPNANNTQTSGYGLRGEFMVGQQLEKYGWEAGPFVRYWNINESNVSAYGDEPKNDRLQTGAKLRVTF